MSDASGNVVSFDATAVYLGTFPNATSHCIPHSIFQKQQLTYNRCHNQRQLNQPRIFKNHRMETVRTALAWEGICNYVFGYGVYRLFDRWDCIFD